MITGRRGGVEAAHVSMADPSVGKTSRGKGQKADDMFVVPLSGALHRKQHSMSEREFWDGYGIDPVKVALALYAVSGNDEEGERIIMETVR